VKRVRLFFALSTAVAVLLVAGCGGSGSPGGAAEVVPADAAFYAVLDTDFDGGQWDAVQELAAKFPGGEDLLGRIVREIESESGEDLDFEQDVDPALGPEVAIVVLVSEPGSDEPETVVVLTQPDDEAALQRLLERGDEPAVSRAVDDWHAISDDEAALDRYETALEGERLADSERFEDAMDGLDEDVLVSFYGDLQRAQEAAEAEGGQPDPLEALFPGGEAPVLGGTARAEEEGARLNGQLVYSGDVEDTPFSSEPYDAELPERVPGDALAYISFNNLERAISAYRDAIAEADPDLESQLGMGEAFLGVSLEEDIAPLFAGEGAVYVRRGALIPEVTLVTQVEDEEQAVATLDDVVAGIGAFVGLGDPERRDVDGVEVREVPISPPFSLSYAAFDGLLVVTTSADGIADLRADEDRLADDEAYEEALDRAGVPGETSGFAYVDLEEALPLLFGYAEAGLGETSEARQYTEPLTSLVYWGEQDGSTQSFSVFVGIE
jgi:tetratricopeptide (TPR) repeat protein